jgi:plastocyanin
MSLALADRVRQTTTSTGTGTITLNGSVEGFQSFTAIGNGNTTYYTISGGAQWEVGIGTYSSGTLARTTVISSSTGSKLDLAAGTKDVFVTLPASVAVTSGTDVTFTKVTSPTVQATNSAGLSLKNSSGTTQLSMGAGGGDNLTLSVSTNINGVNAQVDISPTGTGHVHMKPSGTGSVEIAPTNAGTLDNLVIGGVTPKNGTFVNVAATTGTVSTAPSGGTDIVNKNYADGLAAKWGE